MSRLGCCKYISSSRFNWSDTLAVPVLVLEIEDETELVPNMELNFSLFFVGACKPSCDNLSPDSQ